MLTTFKTAIKRILFFGFIICFFLTMIWGYLGYPIGRVQAQEINNTMKSSTDEQKRWLSQWRESAEKDQLYLYAVKLFKTPVGCEAKLTDNFEGNYFGTLTFRFTGGVKFTIETFPPESSRITIRVPKGFPSELEACDVLQQYVGKIGVRLDWSNPQQQMNGKELVKNFHPFEPELNAAAIQVYQNKKLVEIGFSMAL